MMAFRLASPMLFALGFICIMCGFGLSVSGGSVILFEGDSITDGSRDQSLLHKDHVLGQGYPQLVAAYLGKHRPLVDYKIHNRAISGATLLQHHNMEAKSLFAMNRYFGHLHALKPDVISLLIGINDVWYSVDNNIKLPISDFISAYKILINATRTTLPKVQIIMFEPFADFNGTYLVGKDGKWRSEMKSVQSAVRDIAQQENASLILLQNAFDQAILSSNNNSMHWILDGVHPTPAGNQIIADLWLKKFMELDAF